MKKIIIGIIVILIIVGGIIASKSKESSNVEGQTVRISYIPVSAYWPADVIRSKQLFEAEGIKVEFVNLQSANQAYEAVARGDVDVVPVISVLNVLVPELIAPGNIKVFSISDMTADNAFDSIIVKNDSPIADINGLEGKKIGMLPGTTAKTFLKSYLEKNNIDTLGIQFIELTPPNQLPALASGAVDALFSYEPNSTIAVESGNAKRIHDSVFTKQFDHNPIVMGIISNKLVTENPKLAEKVVEVLNTSYALLDSNEKETRDIVKAAFKLDQNVADKVALTPMGSSDNIDKDRLDRFTEFLVSLGELKSKPDLSNIYYK
jgi:NitT/TauT family transport system substrate-binding protein